MEFEVGSFTACRARELHINLGYSVVAGYDRMVIGSYRGVGVELFAQMGLIHLSRTEP